MLYVNGMFSWINLGIIIIINGKMKVWTCQIIFSIGRLKRGGSSRSNDPRMPTYPTSVRLYNVHNHNIFVAEALRHKDVGVEAIETLIQLFKIGHSPTSALAVLKSDLLAEHGNKYVYASASRAVAQTFSFATDTGSSCPIYRVFTVDVRVGLSAIGGACNTWQPNKQLCGGCNACLERQNTSKDNSIQPASIIPPFHHPTRDVL
ncbi:uncharacterized protein LOC131529990 [Onychostoma macrolepis]|uniref:uncharacterized protein LOC131529990 n=1 Tax=Onychostoma macrolepis TaxID=369639 RepID=UPI00272A959F|nr:uncharacterized protein LOC131529990 [Onychostoma macrolepis]